MAVWRPKISMGPISIQQPCARDRTESDIEETSDQRDAIGNPSPESGAQRNTVSGNDAAVGSDMHIGGDSDLKKPELPSKIQHPT